MANLAGAVRQLRQQRDRAAREVERLDEAIRLLARLVGRKGRRRSFKRVRTKRTPSAAARRRIAAA